MEILFLSPLSSSWSLSLSLSLIHLFELFLQVLSYLPIRHNSSAAFRIVILHYISHKFNVWTSHESTQLPWSKNTFPWNICPF
jgi:hypothetical protein